ncbi:MAG: type II toxin-antitoxin system VapC family toxin [Chitinophagaceae bacterium]|nr:type II toxin-antitoxin system VapC family toxin [Chitinophagaceae bacterium]
MICLDTSILIDFFRKKEKNKSRFFQFSSQQYLFAVSTITEFEIFVGSNSMQQTYWEEFFNQLLILPFTSQAARRAATIEAELKRIGKGLEIPDLMIAATAIENNLKLATLNISHFQRITNLRLM